MRVRNAALAITSLAAALASAQPAGGFDSLIGDGLEGWWGLGTEDPREVYGLSHKDLADKKAASLPNVRQHWKVVSGELHNDGNGLFLTTDRLYGDFELFLEYRTVAQADSGIYLRGIPQVQIWDTTEEGGKWNIGAKAGSGGLWNNSAGAPGKDPLVHADRPFGEWNLVRVVAIGERVSVWLNGQLVVDHARLENYFDRSIPIPKVGPIQLQTHGGEVAWRNVFARELDAEEANAWLADRGNDGFTPIFNGEDFEGWAGPTDQYEVMEGGVMRCRPGQGGTIFTEEVFDDFVVRFEFLLPEGGNNGLAIRYPGKGDAAYVGMCELQILDDYAPKWAGLDPRQYHASVYGQAAPHMGYLRPAGQWNFQEVRVEGSHITVELNGTKIVDVDVSTITEFFVDPNSLVGRDRTEGHFGFCGHGDPVAFRNISAKRLK